jgi:hypothetical protein
MKECLMRLKQPFGVFMGVGALAAFVAKTDAAPLSIRISTPSSRVVVGSPLRIDIVAQNVSAEPIRVSKSVAEDRAALDFEIVVHKRGDGEPTETKWGRRLHGKDVEDAHSGMSIDSGDLPPGGVMKETTFVQRIYNLTMPGRYVIQVEKRGPNHQALGKSNALTITLVN